MTVRFSVGARSAAFRRVKEDVGALCEEHGFYIYDWEGPKGRSSVDIGCRSEKRYRDDGSAEEAGRRFVGAVCKRLVDLGRWEILAGISTTSTTIESMFGAPRIGFNVKKEALEKLSKGTRVVIDLGRGKEARVIFEDLKRRRFLARLEDGKLWSVHIDAFVRVDDSAGDESGDEQTVPTSRSESHE